MNLITLKKHVKTTKKELELNYNRKPEDKIVKVGKWYIFYGGFPGQIIEEIYHIGRCTRIFKSKKLNPAFDNTLVEVVFTEKVFCGENKYQFHGSDPIGGRDSFDDYFIMELSEDMFKIIGKTLRGY